MPMLPPTLPDKLRARATGAATSRRPSPVLLTVTDVAAQLTASTRHVRRLIARGELPAHRIGKLVRISEADLAHFLAGRRHV